LSIYKQGGVNMRRDAEENKHRIETKAKALFTEFGVKISA